MAKDPSKTEQPTPKRIQDARSEGKVITSQDVSALVSLLGGTVLLLHLTPRAMDLIGAQFSLLTRVDCTRPWTAAELQGGVLEATRLLAALLGPLLLVSLVLAVVARVAQVGPFFEVKALAWRPEALNPATGVRQLLPSGENLAKLLLVLGKVTIIGLAAFACVRQDLPTIAGLSLWPLEDGVSWILRRGVVLLLRVLGLFVFIAAVDYALRRRRYFEELMMSRQEIRDEMRNSEGDSHVRGRQRQRMRELTRLRLIAEIPKADVVVVNPVHVAVALRYEPGSWAPTIIAKGLRKRALRIRQAAEKAGVPIVREPAAARALYRHGKVGRYIPDHLFGVVAMILAQLERTGARSFSAARPQVAGAGMGTQA